MQYFLSLLIFLLQVLFVDYGTSGKVERSKLLFMHLDFTKFPIQGINASLANVIPADGAKRWLRKVSSRFLELVSDKDLIAVVCSVDHEVIMYMSMHFITKCYW
jgi:hypothetical protein